MDKQAVLFIFKAIKILLDKGLVEEAKEYIDQVIADVEK